MMDQFSIQQWSNYLEAVFELSLKFEVVVLKVLRQKKKIKLLKFVSPLSLWLNIFHRKVKFIMEY